MRLLRLFSSHSMKRSLLILSVIGLALGTQSSFANPPGSVFAPLPEGQSRQALQPKGEIGTQPGATPAGPTQPGNHSSGPTPRPASDSQARPGTPAQPPTPAQPGTPVKPGEPAKPATPGQVLPIPGTGAQPQKPAAGPGQTSPQPSADNKDKKKCDKVPPESQVQPEKNFLALAQLAMEKHPKRFESEIHKLTNAGVSEKDAKERVKTKLALIIRDGVKKFKDAGKDDRDAKKVSEADKKAIGEAAATLATTLSIEMKDLAKLDPCVGSCGGDAGGRVDETKCWDCLWVTLDVGPELGYHREALKSKLATNDVPEETQVDLNICEEDRPLGTGTGLEQALDERPGPEAVDNLPGFGVPGHNQQPGQTDTQIDIQNQDDMNKIPELNDGKNPGEGNLEDEFPDKGKNGEGYGQFPPDHQGQGKGQGESKGGGGSTGGGGSEGGGKGGGFPPISMGGFGGGERPLEPPPMPVFPEIPQMPMMAFPQMNPGVPLSGEMMMALLGDKSKQWEAECLRRQALMGEIMREQAEASKNQVGMMMQLAAALQNSARQAVLTRRALTDPRFNRFVNGRMRYRGPMVGNRFQRRTPYVAGGMRGPMGVPYGNPRSPMLTNRAPVNSIAAGQRGRLLNPAASARAISGRSGAAGQSSIASSSGRALKK